MTTPDDSDHAVAAHLAALAGEELLRVRTERIAAGVEGRDLRDAGDAESQRVLAAQLNRVRPADAVLSEEARDSTARLSARRVWIIDPLDGTREYSEGRDDWAVHVALWEDGELVAGAVAIPGEGLVLSTLDEPLTRDDPSSLHDSSPDPLADAEFDGPLRLAVSRTRPPEIIAALQELMDIELVPMGSAGVKIAAVVRGDVDAYVHAGGQYEWDSAAPVAVARHRGFYCSRIDGSPLRYNQPDPYLPDLVVCRMGIRATVMGAVATARADAAREDGQ